MFLKVLNLKMEFYEEIPDGVEYEPSEAGAEIEIEAEIACQLTEKIRSQAHRLANLE